MKKIQTNKISKIIMSSKQYKDALKVYFSYSNTLDDEAFRKTIETRIRRFNKSLINIENANKDDERMVTMISTISSLSSKDFAKYFFLPNMNFSTSPSKEGDVEEFVRRDINKDLFDFKEVKYRLLDYIELNTKLPVMAPRTEKELIEVLIREYAFTDNAYYKDHLDFVISYLTNIRFKFRNPLFFKEIFPPLNIHISNLYLNEISIYLNLIENFLCNDHDYLSYIFSPYDCFSDLLFYSSDELIYNFCKAIDYICFNKPDILPNFINSYYRIKNRTKKLIEELKENKNIYDDPAFHHLETYIDRVSRNLIFDKFSFLYKEANEKKGSSKKHNNKYKHFSSYYSSNQSIKKDNSYNTFIKNLDQIKKFIELYPFGSPFHNNSDIPCINLQILNKDLTFEKILCQEFYLLDQEHKNLKIHKNPSYDCSTIKLISSINKLLENGKTICDLNLFGITENSHLLNEDNTIKFVYHLLFTEKIRRGYYREYLDNKIYAETFKLRQDFNRLIEEIFTLYNYDIKFKLITKLNNELNELYDLCLYLS